MIAEQLTKRTLCALSVAICVVASSVATADVEEQEFNVVGTWSSLHNFKKGEKPFWEERLPTASDQKLTGNISPLDELGLKGPELARMLKQGVFDFIHADFGYIAEENPVFEGVGLAGVSEDVPTSRFVSEAYRPVLEEAVANTMGGKLLMQYADPTQVLWCNTPISSLKDMQGKKVRVWNRTLADFVEAVGGTTVTMAFAEVVPALQRKVVDCAITGTISGYLAKWPEVATHLYDLRIAGAGTLFLAVREDLWEALNGDTRALLLEEIDKLERRMWTGIYERDKAGIACATNTGPCPYGEPGEMTLVRATPEDRAFLRKIVEDVILKRWATRCGKECAQDWNDTVGRLMNLTATPE